MTATAILSECLPPDLGGRLRYLRRQRDLYQRDVAAMLGRTLAAVSNWERNRRRPSLAQLQRLAEFYGVPIEVLAGAKVPRG